MKHPRAWSGACALASGLLIAGLTYSQALAADQTKPKPPNSSTSKVPNSQHYVADVDSNAWTKKSVSSLPSGLQDVVAKASLNAVGQPLYIKATLSSPRVYVSSTSPVHYLAVWNLSAASTSTLAGVYPASTINALYDDAYHLENVEQNVLLSPSAGKTWSDGDGAKYTYAYLREIDGGQTINSTSTGFFLSNDIPGITSTNSMCRAYLTFQSIVDLGHAAIEVGEYDEPGLDEMNLFDSGITFSTDDDSATECVAGK